jgi:ParB/RepB/Spo0J family partition protein
VSKKKSEPVSKSKAADVSTVTRGNLYYCLPEGITADPSDNGRWHPSANVDDLVESFLAIGQIQPIEVRHDENRRLRLTVGFRRWLAAKTINEAKLTEEPFKLRYLVKERDPMDAFLANLRENADREGLSPMDYANIASDLMQRFGKSQVETAKILKRSKAWLSLTLGLLELESDIQRKVHTGEIAASTAYDLVKVPVEHRTELLEAIQEDAVPVTRQEVRIRERKRAQERVTEPDSIEGPDADAEPEGPANTPLSRKEICTFWSDLAKSQDGEVAELATQMCRFMDGELTERQMLNRLLKVLSK